MTICGAPGCFSESNDTDCTFHRVPSSLILRTQWILALGPLPDHSYVCSRHFDETMFTNHERKMLVPNAVPKLLVSLPNDPDEAGSSDELIACRACLATYGRLYAISGSGMEEALATLTGTAMPAEASFPRHLCAFCVTKLSKCVAFRDSCRRSTALLESLLEKGPLRIDDIKAFQNSQQLDNNFTCTKVFQFGTDSFMELMPIIKTEINDSSYEEMENDTESENFIKKDPSDVDTCTFELPVEREKPKSRVVESRPKDIEYIKVEVGIENTDVHSEIDDCVESEVENNNSDVDTDVSEETLATVKKRKRTRTSLQENTAKRPKKYGNVKTEVDNHRTDINTDAAKETSGKKKVRKKSGNKSGTESGFDKKNNRKVKLESKEEQEQEVGETNKKKAALSCDLCGKEFKGEKTLTTHKTRHKNTTRKTRAALKKEADLALEKNYNFEVKLLSKEEQKQKIEELKSNRSASGCDLCGKECFKESALMAHKTSCHDSSLPLECDVCSCRFRSRRSLRQHQDRHRALYTCRECGNVSRKRTYAKEHYLVHKGKSYTCPHCQMQYDHSTSYYYHVKTQHPGQNEACDECGETFAGQVGLAVHKRMQHRTNDKPDIDFKCKDCDVTFSSAEALQRHSDLGAGVPHAALWACAACGDSCGSETARANHAAERHPPEHYCKECNKTFSNAASYALHDDRKHKGRRATKVRVRRGRNVCEICGKVFLSMPLLECHMNGHVGLEPFRCHHCPKAFTHKVKLRLHMRVHTGEKPYQCGQCPLAFSLRGNLTRHMKNVHQKVQVACDTCGKTMGAGSLPAHVRAVHRNRPHVRRKRERTNKTQTRVAES